MCLPGWRTSTYSYDRHNVSVKFTAIRITVSQRMNCIYSLWLDASVKQMAVSDLNLYFKNKRLLAAATTTTTTITDAASIRVYVDHFIRRRLHSLL